MLTWTNEDAGVSAAGGEGERTAFDARETAARVAADMTAAFGTWVDVGSAAGKPGLRRPRQVSVETGPPPKRRRFNLVAAVSIGVFVGISVGALIARPHHGPAIPAQPRADGSAGVFSSAPLDPASEPPRRLQVETQSPLGAQAASSRFAQAAPPLRGVSPAAPGEIAGRPDPYRGDWSGRRTAVWNAGRYAQERAGRSALGALPRAIRQPLCAGQATARGRDCLIAASNAADAALRASYRQAAMSGVPNDVLEQDTQAWNDLRVSGGADPEQMILGYRRLATALQGQAVAARRQAQAPGPGYASPDGTYPPW